MAAFGKSCRDSGHGFLSLFDPLQTSSVHRSTSERAVPEGTTHPLEARGSGKTDLPVSYSITSSARSKIDCGTVRSSALAVLRLTTISNFTGNCTGRSPGFAPRRMRST
jgi:hypothetical protein